MGEQLKRNRAKSYMQYADRAYERELETATLFSRTPDTLERAYNCEGHAPVSELVGELVTLHPTADGVRVVHGSKDIGFVLDDHIALAQSIRDEPNCPGFALGRIDDASEASPDFIVTITDHTKDQ